MNLQVLRTHSLKTRVTLVTLVIFLLSIWTLALYSVQSLRSDMEALLSRQQLAIVTQVADQVQREVAARQHALERLARKLAASAWGEKDLQQQGLADDAALDALFNGGAFLTDTDGRAVASMPVEANRIGIAYGDRDYIAAALGGSAFTIGQPVMGRALSTPIVGLSVPVRRADGEMLGALAGIVNLGRPSFLDQITDSTYGKSGSYLLLDAQRRVLVTASDKDRVLELAPAEGMNPSMDRFFQGYDGSQVFVNPLGEEVLASAKRVPGTPWMVVVSLPSHEAFAPIQAQVQRLLVAAAALSVLAAAVVWWVLGQQLQPLARTAQALSDLSGRDEPPAPLPVTRQDEVGTLIASFNRLIEGLAQRQRTLQENEERYRTVFRTSPNAVTISRVQDGVFLDVNDGFLQLTGWSRERVIGHTAMDISLWLAEADRLAFRLKISEEGQCRNHESQLQNRDGRPIQALLSVTPIHLNGEDCLLAVIQDVTAQRAAQDQIQQMAFSDPLTDLPNRRLLMDRMEQALISAIRHHSHCALLHIDLDNFKTVNETMGHDQGDMLLQQAARRLAYSIRDVDTVARLGADEFVVLLEELSTDEGQAAAQAEAIGEKLMAALSQPYHLASSEQFCTCSVGVALFGERAENVLEPLKRAELAMHEAKAGGRKTLRFFDPAMQAVVSARVALEAGLREAIEKRQFVLHYQPQFTEGRQITGAEVLLRWQDPLRGMVSPAEFIPVAEESGLILPMGEWVLETACLQLARWAGQPVLDHLSIAVNVSARQFHQSDFVEQIEAILLRTGAPAERLKIELTESMLVQDINSVIAKMRALKRKGVGFSLDDFGTGYSSLAYLKRLPLDQLKIDQGFVRDILVDPDDAAIARTVIALAQSLNLNVIAEGVETPAQRDRLASLGCHSYQGYLIGRPMPVDEFVTFVESRALDAAA